ncbi:unnamed protein product, partial [Ixodes hexagonus]
LADRTQSKKESTPVAKASNENAECSCQLYGVHKNGTRVGALLYAFNDSLPDEERGNCFGWCRLLVNASWEDGNLFLLDPISNKSVGQQICDNNSQSIANVYVGLFASCFSQLEYTGLKSKMKLCCYGGQHVACPENPAAAVVVSESTPKTSSTPKSSVSPPHLPKT